MAKTFDVVLARQATPNFDLQYIGQFRIKEKEGGMNLAGTLIMLPPTHPLFLMKNHPV